MTNHALAEEQNLYSGCGERCLTMGPGTYCGRAGRSVTRLSKENTQAQKQGLSE